MEGKYKNLAATCKIFTEEYDLSIEQNIASLDLSIKQGYIDYYRLKEELKMAVEDSDFEWLNFAIQNKLIMYDIGRYDDSYAKNLVLNIISGYVNATNTRL